MTRRLSPVKYRHHHTCRWSLRATSVAILCLVIGCSSGPGAQKNTVTAPPTTNAPESFALDGSIAPTPPATSPLPTPNPPLIQAIPNPADTLIAAHRRVQAQARRLTVPADPVAVDLYTLDATCDAYQIEPIQVPRQQSMENTVDLILAEQVIPELTLSGYRTSFDPDSKTVTIDLRVARDSRRVLQSLSMCEQKALLGSLRETLLHQPDWKIKAVIFTNRGNSLVGQ